MLKKLTLFLTLTIVLFVIGCTPSEQPFLNYQNNNFECTASLKVNGEDYTVDIKKNGEKNYLLTFTAPSEISGVSIEKKVDELYFVTGNVRIPLKESSNITAESLKLLDLQKTDLISVTGENIGGVKADIWNFKCDFGTVKLYVSADTELPIRIEAEVKGNEVILTFSSFTLIQE